MASKAWHKKYKVMWKVASGHWVEQDVSDMSVAYIRKKAKGNPRISIRRR